MSLKILSIFFLDNFFSISFVTRSVPAALFSWRSRRAAASSVLLTGGATVGASTYLHTFFSDVSFFVGPCGGASGFCRCFFHGGLDQAASAPAYSSEKKP